MKKKIISAVSALAMIIGSLPTSFAATYPSGSTGWQVTTREENVGKYEITNAESYSGDYSLCIDAQGGNGTAVYMPVPYESGVEAAYSISFVAKIIDDGWYSGSRVAKSVGAPEDGFKITEGCDSSWTKTDLGNDWIRYEGKYYNKEDDRKFVIFVDGPGKVYFDDVKVIYNGNTVLFDNFDNARFKAQAKEINDLIKQCEDADINVQYEKIDANVLTAYADRIGTFSTLSDSITSFQEQELDTMYNETKATLAAYLAGTKTPMPEVYEYKNGDELTVSGKSILNPNGDPYFSVGFGHFDNVSYMSEFDSYGYDNMQIESYPVSAISTGFGWFGWGCADGNVTLSETAGYSGSKAAHLYATDTYSGDSRRRMYQRAPVLPNTEYKLSFKIKGTGTIQYTSKPWTFASSATPASTDRWSTYSSTFTTGNDVYGMDLEFVFNNPVDIYIDEITLIPTGGTANWAANGNFELDTTYGAPANYSESSWMGSAVKTLYLAEKTNQKVCVLLNVFSSWPESIRNAYPDAFTSDGAMILTNDDAKKLVAQYVKYSLEILGRFSSLDSICLTNESAYRTCNYQDAYNPEFRKYLEEVHGSLDGLNSDYGLNLLTEYSSFENITMPTVTANSINGGLKSGDSINKDGKLFYDWMNFNNKVFTEAHANAASAVKSVMPKLPVHTKALSYMRDIDWDSGPRELDLADGANTELFDSFSDWIGNDGGAYLEDSNYYSVENVMKWYDYLNSISDKPIYNSEDHITRDGSTLYNEKQATFNAGSIWQGAIHGKDISTIWIWSNTLDSTAASYGHLYMRPSSIAAVAKTKLDLNRLSKEVTAIANMQPEVGILYSEATRANSAVFENVVDVVYNGAIKSGNKVGFFSEKTAQDKINKYKTIIIPRAIYVEETILDKIKAYQENGGRVIIVGDTSLKANQYGTSYSSSKYQSIYDNATVVAATKSSKSQISAPTVASVQQLLEGRTYLRDTSGNRLSDVEWQSTDYGEGRLVSVYNYSRTDSKTFTVTDTVNGEAKTYDNMKELVSGEAVSNVYTLAPLEHALFYLYDNKQADPEPEPEYGENEVKTLTGSRENGVNTLVWEPKTSTPAEYNVYRISANGVSVLCATTAETTFSETTGAAAYIVRAKLENGLSEGKTTVCEDEKAISISQQSSQDGNVLKINVSVQNQKAHSSYAELSLKVFNEDNSLAGGRDLKVIMPANATSTYVYEFFVNGTARVE